MKQVHKINIDIDYILNNHTFRYDIIRYFTFYYNSLHYFTLFYMTLFSIT